jgi:hypothetical protein
MENAIDFQHIEGLEDDFELLDIAHDYLTEAMMLISPRKLEAMVADWLKGHLDYEPDEAETDAIDALATDACLFAPSLSGATALDRFIAGIKTDDPQSKQALKLLSRSEIRHVRIVGRPDSDLVELEDCITLERLMLIDAAYTEASQGLECLMRLCRLESGRTVQINWPFVLTAAMKDIIATYARSGKGIANPYRCACAVYKRAARDGVIAMPREPFDDEETEQAVVAVLDAEWSAGKGDPDRREEFMAELRDSADAETLLAYMRLYSLALEGTMPVSADNMREICEAVIEILLGSGGTGVTEADEPLTQAQQMLSDLVEQGNFREECKTLLDGRLAAHRGRS